MALQSREGALALPVLDRVAKLLSLNDTPGYLVGGCLRDAIGRGLQDSARDVDIAVQGDPSRIAKNLATALGASLAPLDPDRGIFRLMIPAPAGEVGSQTCVVDLTGFSGSIEEDLARRDFTIDAMALDLSERERPDWPDRVVDPFGGRADLVRKRVRAVLPSVFRDDPGRLMRSLRLCSQLGFALDPDTASLVRSEAHRVGQVSPERVRDEFLAILSLPKSKTYLVVLDRLDLLCRVIPELEATKEVEQPVVHYWDVWGHTLHCVEAAEHVTQGHQNSPVFMFAPWTPQTESHFSEIISDGYSRRTVLKLGALFHDIAKPQTKTVDESGRTRFLGHSEMGAAMAEQRLKHLRVGNRAIGLVSKMVEHHLRPGNMRQETEMPTPRAVYRYYRDLGDAAVDTLFLALADYLAAKGPNLALEQWSAHARMIGCILEAGEQQPQTSGPARLVTGHEVMDHLALEPGPLVGDIVQTLIEAQASGEIHTREEALALAEQVLSGRQVRE